VLFSGMATYGSGPRPILPRGHPTLFPNAPLTQLFNIHKSKSRARRGFVQRDCIRRVDTALDDAGARPGPPDTTFFII
jgi:hypothetical protein